MPSRRGQSILEYTIIIGIVTVVLFYMGTGVKRGVQSLVKVTADQVGSQQNSDQDFNDATQGYLVSSNSFQQQSKGKQVIEEGYIQSSGNVSHMTNMIYNERTESQSGTVTNGGFAQNN